VTTPDIPFLLKQLKSFDEEERKSAVLGLLRTREPMAIPVLSKLATDDPSLEVRYFARKACYTLKELGCVSPADPPSENLIPADQTPLPVLLHASDPRIRFNALKRVLAHPTPEGTQLIRECARRETHPELLASFLTALGRLGTGGDIELLGSFLKHPDPRVRANAVESLAGIGGNSAITKLIPCLQDMDNRVLANTIKALQVFGTPELLKLLRTMAKSKHVPLRDSAIFALEKFRNPLSVMILSEITRGDPEPHLRAKAHQALLRLAERGSIQAQKILRVLFSSSEAQGKPRSESVSAETDTGNSIQSKISEVSTELKQQLLREVDSPDPSQRQTALQRISEILEPSMGPELAAALERETDPFVSSQLLMFLGKLKAKEGIFAVERRLSDPNDRTRANAVEAGVQIDPAVFHPRIFPLVKDPNNRVKANAIVALARKADFDIRPFLRELLEDPQPVFRKSGLFALTLSERIETGSLLSLVLEDPDPEVRILAHQTIRSFSRKGWAAATLLVNKLPAAPTEKTANPNSQFASRFENTVQLLQDGQLPSGEAEKTSPRFSGEVDQAFYELGQACSVMGHTPKAIEDMLRKTELEISRLEKRVQKMRKKSQSDRRTGALGDAVRESGGAGELDHTTDQLEAQKRHLLITAGRLIAEHPDKLPKPACQQLGKTLSMAVAFIDGDQKIPPVDFQQAFPSAFTDESLERQEDNPIWPVLFIGLVTIQVLQLPAAFNTTRLFLGAAFFGLLATVFIGFRGKAERDWEGSFWLSLPWFFAPHLLATAQAEGGFGFSTPLASPNTLSDSVGMVLPVLLPLGFLRILRSSHFPRPLFLVLPLLVYHTLPFVFGIGRTSSFAQALADGFGETAGPLLINITLPFLMVFLAIRLGTVFSEIPRPTKRITFGVLILFVETFLMGSFLMESHALPTLFPAIWSAPQAFDTTRTRLFFPDSPLRAIDTVLSSGTGESNDTRQPIRHLAILPRHHGSGSYRFGVFAGNPGSGRNALRLDSSSFQLTLNGHSKSFSCVPVFSPGITTKVVLCLDTRILNQQSRKIRHVLDQIHSTLGTCSTLIVIPFGKEPSPVIDSLLPGQWQITALHEDLFSAIGSALRRYDSRQTHGPILCLAQEVAEDAIPPSFLYDKIQATPHSNLSIVSLRSHSSAEEKLRELVQIGKGGFYPLSTFSKLDQTLWNWFARIPTPWEIEVQEPIPPFSPEPLHITMEQHNKVYLASEALFFEAAISGMPETVEFFLDDHLLKTLKNPIGSHVFHEELSTSLFAPGSHSLFIRLSRPSSTASSGMEVVEGQQEAFFSHTCPHFLLASPQPGSYVLPGTPLHTEQVLGNVAAWKASVDGKPLRSFQDDLFSAITQPGRHLLTLRATSPEGAFSERSAVFFTRHPRPKPVFVFPKQNSELFGRIPVQLDFPYQPGQETPRQVEIRLADRALLSMTHEPWFGSIDVGEIPPGMQTLTALITDSAGEPFSASIEVHISHPAFFVAFDGLFPGQVVSDYTIGSFMVHNKSLSYVSSVEIFLDGRLLESFTEEPYDFILEASRLPPGDHELKAIARRSDGNTAETVLPFVKRTPEITGLCLPPVVSAASEAPEISLNGENLASFSLEAWGNQPLSLFCVAEPALRGDQSEVFAVLPAFQKELVSLLNPPDHLFLLNTSGEFQSAAIPGERGMKTDSAISDRRKEFEPSQLFLSALKAKAFRSSSPRFLLLITEGWWQVGKPDESFFKTFAEIRESLEKEEIRLFCLVVGSRPLLCQGYEANHFRALAEGSGGSYWHVPTAHHLPQYAEKVIGTLRGHHLLTCSPNVKTALDQVFHLLITPRNKPPRSLTLRNPLHFSR
jgi:HEAT repeat protein